MQVDGNVAKIDLAARGVDGVLVHFNAPSWAVRAVMSSTTLPVCPKTGSTSPSLTVHLCLHTALLREIGNAPPANCTTTFAAIVADRWRPANLPAGSGEPRQRRLAAMQRPLKSNGGRAASSNPSFGHRRGERIATVARSPPTARCSALYKTPTASQISRPIAAASMPASGAVKSHTPIAHRPRGYDRPGRRGGDFATGIHRSGALQLSTQLGPRHGRGGQRLNHRRRAAGISTPDGDHNSDSSRDPLLITLVPEIPIAWCASNASYPVPTRRTRTTRQRTAEPSNQLYRLWVPIPLYCPTTSRSVTDSQQAESVLPPCAPLELGPMDL